MYVGGICNDLLPALKQKEPEGHTWRVKQDKCLDNYTRQISSLISPGVVLRSLTEVHRLAFLFRLPYRRAQNRRVHTLLAMSQDE